MVGHAAALEGLWTDRCRVEVREKSRDPETGLTGFAERLLYEGLLCRLSFTRLQEAGEGAAVEN